MHDRPQMPAPPKDCVYGPWWDEGVNGQGCWCYSNGELSYAWLPSFSVWVVTEKVALRKLLRLANELAQRDARIKELEDGLLDLNLVCHKNGKIGWVVGDPTYLAILRLLKGGPDA